MVGRQLKRPGHATRRRIRVRQCRGRAYLRLKTDGSIVCWGDNSSGQATPPAGAFAFLSAGYSYNCGLKTDRSIVCWGDNSSGQAAPPVGAFASVSAGYFHACALKTDGSVTCWGDNSSGQGASPAGAFGPSVLGGNTLAR